LLLQLPEHIKAHYKTWLDYINEKVSVTLSVDLTKRVHELLSIQIGAPNNILTMRPLLGGNVHNMENVDTAQRALHK